MWINLNLLINIHLDCYYAILLPLLPVITPFDMVISPYYQLIHPPVQ